MIQSILSIISNFINETNLGYIVIFLCVIIGHYIMNRSTANGNDRQPGDVREGDNDDDEEEDPPRNFTFEQLRYFDGKMNESSNELKPVYLSLNGIVFDVSEGRDFYGEGGPYEQFAGHECGIALAKMSFDTTYLDDISGCQSLSYVEKDELDNWIQKFTHYRCYPVKGRLIADNDLPDPNRIISSEELAKNNGDGEIPAGYAAAPIYVGAGDKVYDMSFGGVTFYGKGCSYNVFAGRDASRALALMSLDPKDAMNPDVSDLDEKKIKVLNDWINTFSEKKKYPVVGTLKKN